MALINTASLENAEGTIKEAYDMFMKNLGVIPRPLEMMSASPAIFDQQLQRIQYYTDHPTLSFALLSHIRYLVAHNLNYSFCMDFNKLMLKKQGLEPPKNAAWEKMKIMISQKTERTAAPSKTLA